MPAGVRGRGCGPQCLFCCSSVGVQQVLVEDIRQLKKMSCFPLGKKCRKNGLLGVLTASLSKACTVCMMCVIPCVPGGEPPASQPFFLTPETWSPWFQKNHVCVLKHLAFLAVRLKRTDSFCKNTYFCLIIITYSNLAALLYLQTSSRTVYVLDFEISGIHLDRKR